MPRDRSSGLIANVLLFLLSGFIFSFPILLYSQSQVLLSSNLYPVSKANWLLSYGFDYKLSELQLNLHGQKFWQERNLAKISTFAFQYGAVENFEIGMALSYESLSANKFFGSSSLRTNTEELKKNYGLTEPHIWGKYFYRLDTLWPSQINVQFGHRFSIGERKLSSQEIDGNVRSGGASTNLDVQLLSENQAEEVYFISVLMDYKQTREIAGSSLVETYDVTGGHQIVPSLGYQKFKYNYSLYGKLGFPFQSKEVYRNKYTSYSSPEHLNLNLSIGVSALIRENVSCHLQSESTFHPEVEFSSGGFKYLRSGFWNYSFLSFKVDWKI